MSGKVAFTSYVLAGTRFRVLVQLWTSAGIRSELIWPLGSWSAIFIREKRERPRMMVLHHRRAGGQSQHPALLDMEARSDRVQAALQYARRNLSSNLSVGRAHRLVAAKLGQ